ncbi:MAG: SDR family NAD(P)-dependent oxidoreductase, partial [Parvibaculales bacterium]
MTGRLNNMAIIVTGAGAGLGRSSATRLAEEGAQVLSVDINAETAQETADMIIAAGGKAQACQADMSHEADIIEMVKQAKNHFGGINGLLANAGIAGTGAAHETSLEDWNNLITISLTGKWLCAKHVLPY